MGVAASGDYHSTQLPMRYNHHKQVTLSQLHLHHLARLRFPQLSKVFQSMSVTTVNLQRARDANDSDAVAEQALLQYESEIDVAPYFYDQVAKPQTPAFVGMMDTVGDAIGGMVNPTTVGIAVGAANPFTMHLQKSVASLLKKRAKRN